MSEFGELLAGYRRFRAGAYPQQKARYDRLSSEGQSPRFQVGHLLKIDSEYLRVPAVNTLSDTLTVLRGVNAGFLAQFARGGCEQRFAWILAAGHRLPMVRKVGTFDQQYVEVDRVDDDERGNRDLVGHRCVVPLAD